MKVLVSVCVSLCACSVGPKLVTVPMLESAPIASSPVDVDQPDNADGNRAGEITGVWEGRAWQVGNKSWPLTVTFDKPHGVDVVAHAQYPEQRCRAGWKLHSSEARHWAGEELIELDPLNRCANHGRVTVDVIDEETLNWRWTSGGLTASATLERSGDAGR